MVRNVPRDRFIIYKDEFNFIENHYRTYGSVPDKHTFIATYPETELFNVKENPEYLIEKLNENYTYSILVPFVKKIAELSQVDSRKAVDYACANIKEIQRSSQLNSTGTDVLRTFDSCVLEYQRRMACKGLLGKTSGIAQIDKITNGWMDEDLVIIAGRTNEGKSWLLLYFLLMAHRAGHPVLLWSGEMELPQLQMRIASLHGHFSNFGIMSGNVNLGINKNVSTFVNYGKEMSNSEVPFIVVTPKDLKGRKLTVSGLESLVELHNPAIIGIDQLSLMKDEREGKNDQRRLQYAHISEDLFLLSSKKQIPILVAAQANRDAVKEKKNKNSSPEIEHVAESDDVSHNATRLITIKQIDNKLKLSLKKNRYGIRGCEWTLHWNIDVGDIHVIENNAELGEEENKKLEGEDLF